MEDALLKDYNNRQHFLVIGWSLLQPSVRNLQIRVAQHCPGLDKFFFLAYIILFDYSQKFSPLFPF